MFWRMKYTLIKKSIVKGFPGGSMVKNPWATTGDRFDPWSRKIPHAAEKLSLWAATTELKLQLSEPHMPRVHAVQEERPPLEA